MTKNHELLFFAPEDLFGRNSGMEDASQEADKSNIQEKPTLMQYTRKIWAAAMIMCQIASGYAAPQAEAAPHRLGGRPDFSISEIPAGRFRSQLDQLKPDARQNAEAWLRRVSFPRNDVDSLAVDPEGGIYYIESFLPEPDTTDSASVPSVSEGAALPISPFPESLLFHSRPGAPNILYIDFDGEMISGTAWNTSLGIDPIPAVAFSTDLDRNTFSDADQAAIKRIWQRVAEDYAPFDIDVTTERPATFTSRTAHALVTRNTDANGAFNPSSGSGGVAYLDVFGASYYANYRPAWIYDNNLAQLEYNISEAVSHEVGHNLGLSHDGKTDGTSYYSGHGTGNTSWGTLMGASYGKNVTQWSRGEYYMANNAEDDLASIAANLSYRADDHGDTLPGASFLTMSDGTNILSTTPENDPANLSPFNKGIIEQNDDVDLFSFVTGTGAISFTLKPWLSPAGTRGGNLDAQLRLLDADGRVIAQSNPADNTDASVATNVPAGLYYLEIAAVSFGEPLISPPSGYTQYGSIGQYFISGFVTDPTGLAPPPHAELFAQDMTELNTSNHLFDVRYTDQTGIDTSSLDDFDILVRGPADFVQAAKLVAVDFPANGTPRTATYSIDAPSGTWTSDNNGTYTATIVSNQVANIHGVYVESRDLGTFKCQAPQGIYYVDMSSNPGWTLDGDWAYGPPAGIDGDPNSGSSGTNVVGFNLSGSYGRKQSMIYASTPQIDCSGSQTVSLRFNRWLGMSAKDSACLDVSSDGINWISLWLSNEQINDAGWVSVQYDLSAVASNQPAVQLRWGLASNADGNLGCGWNLDDVELLADGAIDTHPPAAQLNAPNLLEGGGAAYSFSVSYADETAVAVASLDGNDLTALGPGGYSNTATFVGVDVFDDGTPRTATYRIPAPGGEWNDTDGGTYEIYLNSGQVMDTAGNATPAQMLGSFLVDIQPTWTLTVAINNPLWGSVTPDGGSYRAGTEIELLATATNYSVFSGWSGAASGTNNPITVTIDSDKTVTAAFSELVTTNHPTPYWWLAENGYASDFENASLLTGANGYLLWESYIAGLNPNDANDALVVYMVETNGALRLEWSTVTGRLYTVLGGTNLLETLTPMSNAVDLNWTQQFYTVENPGFYRLRVRKP